MTKVPSLGYEKVIRALQGDGLVVVRQKGSHTRLQKHMQDEILKLTSPYKKIHALAYIETSAVIS